MVADEDVSEPERKYDVALSFAGEDRDYVGEVAAGLVHRGYRVFYDRYEEANLWGKDLYEHLEYVYRDAAEYCVLFASEAYAEKVWPTHERRSAQERALLQHSEYILPARFDDTAVPGIRGTIGYIDLRTHSPEELVSLIVIKLGPRERTNFFPEDLSRLYERLDIEDDDDKRLVRRHAYNFFYEFIQLDPIERELVVTVFDAGCPGNMPEDMHIHVEKIRRWVGVEPADLPAKLRRMGPFGFEHRLYSDSEETSEDGDDQLVALRWIDLGVSDDEDEEPPDEDFVMTVVVEMVDLMYEERCLECIKGILKRCDFSPLGAADT